MLKHSTQCTLDLHAFEGELGENQAAMQVYQTTLVSTFSWSHF